VEEKTSSVWLGVDNSAWRFVKNPAVWKKDKKPNSDGHSDGGFISPMPAWKSSPVRRLSGEYSQSEPRSGRPSPPPPWTERVDTVSGRIGSSRAGSSWNSATELVNLNSPKRNVKGATEVEICV
jgi:hypothetical protein